MKETDYKIVYSKTCSTLGDGQATNLVKRRWADRWIYMIADGSRLQFNRQKDAKEYLVAFGNTMTFGMSSCLELCSETLVIYMNVMPYTNMNSGRTAMNYAVKCIEFTESLRRRFGERESEMIHGRGESQLARDRRQLNYMLETLSGLVEILRAVSKKKKEYILQKQLDRIKTRLNSINRDFQEYRVEGWQKLPDVKTGLIMVHKIEVEPHRKRIAI